MADNRLYLTVRPDGEDPRQVLLAKGWADGWQVWEPETLTARIIALLEVDGLDNGCTNFPCGPTCVTVEDENHQKDNPESVKAATDGHS